MANLKIASIIVSSCATNCYLGYDPETKRGFIVDPGDSPERILREIEKLGFTPEAILLTHGHFDHIGGALVIKNKLNLPVIALDKEEEQLADSRKNMTAMYGEEAVSIKADRWLTDGEEFDLIGKKAKAIHTPGHTVGGMCIYFPEEGRLISGDTLFCESLGRYDFPGGSGRAIIASIINKLFVLPEDTIVYPGHGEATTIEHEKKYNPVAQFIGKI